VSTWEGRKPILITGSHRSGSTWLASMLALSKNSLVAHEPFSIQPWAYALDGLAKHWFTYAPVLPQAAALEALSKVIERRTRKIFLRNQLQHWIPPLRRNQRLIIKDPIRPSRATGSRRTLIWKSSSWCGIRLPSQPA